MKKGFTLVELLMVIVVMAMLATLATGAAMKAIQSAKEKRIEATRVTLKMALVNYQAAEGRRAGDSQDADNAGKNSDKLTFSGERNKYVFGPLLKDPKKHYLDPSGLLTKVPGSGVLPLREAMEKFKGRTDFPIGYPHPEDSNVFKYYKVTYDLSNDMVNVER